MKFSTSRLAKTAKNRHFRPTLTCWGLFFYRKTKITSFQSILSDILEDVIGCKETNSRPLHESNI